MKKIYYTPHLLFTGLFISLIWPGKTGLPYNVMILTGIIELIFIARLILARTLTAKTSAGDVVSVIYLFLFLWQLFTAHPGFLDKMLFPEPEIIFSLFISEIPDMMKGLASSMFLLVCGYGIALLTAIPLGLVIGWRKRLFHAVNPFAKVLGPIPPIVYIPYAIALLPTFKMASVFVIFIGAFWPVFINTLNGVFNIPGGLIDAARVINLNERTLLLKIILPGAMPSICAGASLGLFFSFVLLTAAELIGATSGIGWYVKNFSDFADYPRVIVGVLFIGIIVTAITIGTEKLEHHLLRWRK